MTTVFALLSDRCGLSIRGAASLLGVREDTVKSWRAGRNGAPPAVIGQMRALYTRMERAAVEAAAQIAQTPAAEIEMGLASDDHEAQSLGWPCVGVHAAVLGLVVARTSQPVRIVPRGSTTASAASAEAHRR